MPEAICCCLQTCYVMLLLMDCMCIPTLIVVTLLVVWLHTQIALYYNVWPGAILHTETESKRLTNLLNNMTLHILPLESTTVQNSKL